MSTVDFFKFTFEKELEKGLYDPCVRGSQPPQLEHNSTSKEVAIVFSSDHDIIVLSGISCTDVLIVNIVTKFVDLSSIHYYVGGDSSS